MKYVTLMACPAHTSHHELEFIIFIIMIIICYCYCYYLVFL